MVPQSVLIGIIVAIVGYFLQQRAWRQRLYEETRQREFDECLKLIESLSRAVDKRLMALLEFHLEIEKKTVTDDVMSSYKESVRNWMHDFSSHKSKIQHYFGEESMLIFENEVHAKLRDASNIILRTKKYGLNLSKKDRNEYDSVQDLIGMARFSSFKFLKDLNDLLSNGFVGRTSMYNNTKIGYLDLISRIYLIQRLFGLKS